MTDSTRVMAKSNEIMLRRRQKALLLPGSSNLPAQYVATLLKNLSCLGFTCSEAQIACMRTQSEAEMHAFLGQIVPALRAMVGANVKYTPLYPNFPEQVMEASEAELFINAMLHYLGDWVGLRITPVYEKTAREALFDGVPLKVIDLGTEAELRELGQKLIGANTSLSDTDKADVAFLIQTYATTPQIVLPEDIPHKENLAFTTGLLLAHTDAAHTLLDRYFRVATDVLRLAAGLSDGDVSLAQKTKFKSFNRKERRLLLGLLERCNGRLEDMVRNKEPFKRLGERLHPGEYAKRFPRTAEAFTALRNEHAVVTFNSRVETALRNRDLNVALTALATRPGELARRLDQLLRLGTPTTAVVEAFESVADEVATPVLLQVLTHFERRNEPAALRSFFPKGSVAKVICVPNELPELPASTCTTVASVCRSTLLARFAQLEPLGTSWIDPALKNYLVPFSQRSASKSLRTLVRGSNVPMPEGETIRFFLWWREGKVDGKTTGRVDIDLSAAMYDGDWMYKEHISYTNLRSAKYRAAHSGDITSAPAGASEFIDLDIQSIVDHGGRYVVMCVFSFTGQALVKLPECFGGWMARSKPQSGEIFEPRTVVDKVDLTADSKCCLPAVLDLVERRVYWTDIALRTRPGFVTNLEEHRGGVTQMGRALTTLRKTTLHTLFSLHAEARGGTAESARKADTVFSVSGGVTPFDIEAIMTDYLA